MSSQTWLAMGTWVYATGTCVFATAAIMGINAWRNQLRTNYRLSLLRKYYASVWDFVQAMDMATYYMPRNAENNNVPHNAEVMTHQVRQLCHAVWVAFLKFEVAQSAANVPWVAAACPHSGDAFKKDANIISDAFKTLYDVVQATPPGSVCYLSSEAGSTLRELLANDRRSDALPGTAGAIHNNMNVLLPLVELEIEKLLCPAG